MTTTATPASLKQYECGAFRFTGQSENDHYDRHLVFDHVVAPEEASQRERFEAVARSLRDLLTQRWLLTQETHDRENPK
jgi:starch phosphorylase